MSSAEEEDLTFDEMIQELVALCEANGGQSVGGMFVIHRDEVGDLKEAIENCITSRPVHVGYHKMGGEDGAESGVESEEGEYMTLILIAEALTIEEAVMRGIEGGIGEEED